MKRTLLSLSLLAASVGAWIAPETLQAAEATTTSAIALPDPAQQLGEVTRLLRNNDLTGLVRTLMSPEQFQELRAEYERERSRPISEEERAEFAETFDKLIAPDAVERLMAEIEPKLIEARPQAQGAILMGLGAAQMALAQPDAELTPEQRTLLQQALPGVREWLTGTDFLSSQTMRQALTIVTDAARGSGIANIDQLRMLSLEEVLTHAGRVLGASKRAVALYGIDLDAIAATIRYETLEVSGNEARVRVSFTVFNAPLSHEVELRYEDGRWFGHEHRIHVEHDDEEAES